MSLRKNYSFEIAIKLIIVYIEDATLLFSSCIFVTSFNGIMLMYIRLLTHFILTPFIVFFFVLAVSSRYLVLF